MNKRTVLSTILLALGILFVQAKDYKYTTVPGDLMNTRIYTLDNVLPRPRVWHTIWST